LGRRSAGAWLKSRRRRCNDEKAGDLTAVEPIIAFAGRLVLIEVPRFDAGGEQRIALQIERLAAVGLGDAHVADQHGLLRKRANR
jgi:hypothetical protein